MALQLSSEQADGQTGNYWRIFNLEYCIDGATNIVVYLYKDSTARAADKSHMSRHKYSFSAPDFSVADLEANYLLAYAYTKLKAHDDFTGATDV